METRIYKRLGAALTFVLLVSALGLSQTVDVADGRIGTPGRNALAVRYRAHESTTIDMAGSSLGLGLYGKADIRREEGRTRIKLSMKGFVNPQSLSPFYTTYVLWSISPEGQADNLAEMPYRRDSNIQVTTPLQTFALIITAEPYSAVQLPSPAVVAENVLRSHTKGVPETTEIKYRGDAGTLYAISGGATRLSADYNTPLVVLGARRAVEIARRAGAARFDQDDIHQAEIKLAVLEQTWNNDRKTEENLGAVAREVMQLAEHAREMAAERSNQAMLNAERQAAANNIAQARSEAGQAESDAAAARQEAGQARTDAERARQQSEQYREALAKARQQTDEARERVKEAQTEADRARANEQLARAEADQARIEKQDAEEHLYESLNRILETRREARGLIVNLSDVLFDFNRATLKPGARERLSKLAGVLLAYPGNYRLEVEGHTDSIGSDAYNFKLSESRAQAVADYLIQAQIPTSRIAEVRGMGKTMPVASNDTAAGRQLNRRVEIVISDLEK